MRTLVDISPLLKTFEWYLATQVARDAVQFVQQLYETDQDKQSLLYLGAIAARTSVI